MKGYLGIFPIFENILFIQEYMSYHVAYLWNTLLVGNNFKTSKSYIGVTFPNKGFHAFVNNRRMPEKSQVIEVSQVIQ